MLHLSLSRERPGLPCCRVAPQAVVKDITAPWQYLQCSVLSSSRPPLISRAALHTVSAYNPDTIALGQMTAEH